MCFDRLANLAKEPITVFGYQCQFLYEEGITDVSPPSPRGYWLCKKCRLLSIVLKDAWHLRFCEHSGQKDAIRFIQVINPNWKVSIFECRNPSMISSSEVERIRKVMKPNTPPTTSSSSGARPSSTFLNIESPRLPLPPASSSQSDGFEVEGYANRFIYDANRSDRSGVWQCRCCKKAFLEATPPIYCTAACEQYFYRESILRNARFVLKIGPNWDMTFNKIEPVSHDPTKLEEWWGVETNRILFIVKNGGVSGVQKGNIEAKSSGDREVEELSAEFEDLEVDVKRESSSTTSSSSGVPSIPLLRLPPALPENRVPFSPTKKSPKNPPRIVISGATDKAPKKQKKKK